MGSLTHSLPKGIGDELLLGGTGRVPTVPDPLTAERHWRRLGVEAVELLPPSLTHSLPKGIGDIPPGRGLGPVRPESLTHSLPKGIGDR